MSDTGTWISDRCEHFAEIRPLRRVADGCEECVAMGAAWTELRVCLTCGHVGCCEDSLHAHALQHFNTSGHPLIVPLKRHETWGWCYVHHRYFDPMPALPFKQPSPVLAFLRRLRRS